MGIPKKLKTVLQIMENDRVCDFISLRSMSFDEVWGVVHKQIEDEIAKGGSTPPMVVVRKDDGELSVGAVDHWPHGERDVVLVKFISKMGLAEDHRIVGAVVFSEAYATSADEMGTGVLGDGDVPGSREILVAVSFDGLTGDAELRTASIERPDGKPPYLNEWDVFFRPMGDLVEGLAMGIMVHNLRLLDVSPIDVVDAMRMAEVN